MQLNQRLKRVEADFAENNLLFCGCFDGFVNQMIDGIYNETSYETDVSTLPKGFCEKCRKPVDSERMENLNQQIDLIYGEIFDDLKADQQ
jgi:hypothetical protein